MIDSHIISALGWTLIHFLWQGSAIVLTYWLISRSSKSLHAKYWTGMVAVLLCLLIPTSQFISLIQTTEVTQGTFYISTTYQSMALKPMSMWETFIMLTNQSLPYMVMAWAIVVLGLTSSLVRSWFKLNAIEHDCSPTLSAELKQFIKNTAIKLDLATIPILKVSKKILVPAAYGVYKPTVLLPLSLLSQIPKDQIHAIITHELCHLKRNDFLHNILQLTTDILLFFHPLIRWMNNDIRQVREQCCDQLVLSQNTHAITYAKALTNIASLSNGHNFGPRLQIGINDGLLLKRVKFLLQNNSSQSSIMMFAPLAILLLACFYLFQSDQTPLVHNESISNNQLSQKPKFNKRLVSNLFYPNGNQSPEQEAFVPTTAEINLPETKYLQTPATKLNILTEPTTFELTKSITNLNPNKLELGISTTDLDEELNNLFNLSLAAAMDTHSPEEDNTLLQGKLEPLNSDSSIKGTSSLFRPKLLAYIAPEYPNNFWGRQIEQTVIASFKIKPNGKLFDVQLTSQGNNYVAFEQSVKNTLKKWRFDKKSLNTPSLQRTYQRIFEFKLSQIVEKNCNRVTTGSRMKKATVCNQSAVDK